MTIASAIGADVAADRGIGGARPRDAYSPRTASPVRRGWMNLSSAPYKKRGRIAVGIVIALMVLAPEAAATLYLLLSVILAIRLNWPLH